MTFIGRAVESVYNSIFEAGAKRQPTIKDVRKELLVMEEKSDNQYDINIIHSVILTLEVYTEGVYDMFAYESDVDISTNRFVCFGLKNVPEKLAACNGVDYVFPFAENELQPGVAESNEAYC